METITLREAMDRARQGQAIALLARRQAINITKRQLQAEGLRSHHMPRAAIVARANTYLIEHREELIAEAKQTVERWRQRRVLRQAMCKTFK